MSYGGNPPQIPDAFLKAVHHDLSPQFPVERVLAEIRALRAEVADLKEALVGPQTSLIVGRQAEAIFNRLPHRS